MVERKISLQNLKIKRLSKKHKNYFNQFTCFEQELTDFLKEDSVQNQEKRISVTHLWFYENKLIAYVTLLTDKISLNAGLKEKFRKEGINYKSLPAIKIGRLCVDDRYTRKGIGTHIIDFIVQIIAKTNDFAGCRFITLDAKKIKEPEKNPKYFYKKLGFEILKERKKGAIPMYKDVGKLISELRQKHPSS